MERLGDQVASGKMRSQVAGDGGVRGDRQADFHVDAVRDPLVVDRQWLGGWRDVQLAEAPEQPVERATDEWRQLGAGDPTSHGDDALAGNLLAW